MSEGLKTVRTLRILFFLGFVVWTVGALSYSIYPFWGYRDPYYVEPNANLYMDIFFTFVVLGAIIVFLSVGLMLFSASEQVRAKSALGLIVLVSGVILYSGAYIYDVGGLWARVGVPLRTNLGFLIWTMSFYLMGMGIGISVFGSVLPRRTGARRQREAGEATPDAGLCRNDGKP